MPLTSREQQVAEEATGVRQTGALRIFSHHNPDRPITPERALEIMEMGGTIEIPAAGAGSYRQVADMLWLDVKSTWDTTSSAGDWSILLTDGRMLHQSNRYPRLGFTYSIEDNPEL
jgi:hypothetical protein